MDTPRGGAAAPSSEPSRRGARAPPYRGDDRRSGEGRAHTRPACSRPECEGARRGAAAGRPLGLPIALTPRRVPPVKGAGCGPRGTAADPRRRWPLSERPGHRCGPTVRRRSRPQRRQHPRPRVHLRRRPRQRPRQHPRWNPTAVARTSPLRRGSDAAHPMARARRETRPLPRAHAVRPPCRGASGPGLRPSGARPRGVPSRRRSGTPRRSWRGSTPPGGQAPGAPPGSRQSSDGDDPAREPGSRGRRRRRRTGRRPARRRFARSPPDDTRPTLCRRRAPDAGRPPGGVPAGVPTDT